MKHEAEPQRLRSSIERLLLLPWRELQGGLDLVLKDNRSLVLTLLGLLLGWWLYVPVHELLHVVGCLATGGAVETLEISPLYFGALLERIFPFVVAGGDYAGRLSGFTPAGDLGWIATSMAPWILCFAPGVWLARAAARSGRAILWGATLPFAFAPFLSLTGDAYEIGSLVLAQVPGHFASAASRNVLVGDDVVRVVSALTDAGPSAVELVGLLLGISLAVLFAWVCFGLASRCAVYFGQAELQVVSGNHE